MRKTKTKTKMKKMKRKAIVCLFVQVVFDIIWDSTFVPSFILCWQSFAHLSDAAVFFSYISILIHANQVEKDVSALVFSLPLHLSSISFIHRKSIFHHFTSFISSICKIEMRLQFNICNCNFFALALFKRSSNCRGDIIQQKSFSNSAFAFFNDT